MNRHGKKKLTLSKERIRMVGGAAWHRTTGRCHETFETYCVTCYSDCVQETCCCGATGTCAYVSFCACSFGCVPGC